MNLKGRSMLSLFDFSSDEIEYLIDLAIELKAAKKEGREQKKLTGKNIALIFEKDSTRTRCAFEVAGFDQGAHTTYLGPLGSQFGIKESVADTARVLGRLYDAIEFRGFLQRDVEDLAKYAGVPVWNGLTDTDHPTQVIADFMTAKEHLKKPFNKMTFAYVGDGHNNVAIALMIGAAKMGMDFRIVSHKNFFPAPEVLEKCKKIAKTSGGKITVTESVTSGVAGADIIYTDVWVSMGEPNEVWGERIALLKKYQVTKEMLAKTGNPDVIFMHCLPACHDIKTQLGLKIFEKYDLSEMEVTNEVFESKHSVVFDEAENRMHTTKAIMVATLG